jgi:hypothetical protein
MWLMTKHGFYSIVEKAPGQFHVRSRERHDLQNLVDRIPLAGQKIIATPDADYAARLIVDRATLMSILLFLGETLDYGNFKDTVDSTPDQKHKPYHDIWSVLAKALGAYGQPGNRQMRK